MGFERDGRRRRCAAMFAGSLLTFTLGACSSGSEEGSSDELLGTFLVSGSVGDGPIVDAEVRLIDANGNLAGTAASDGQADYRIDVAVDTPLPVTVHIAGGIDLVTGRAPDFALTALLREVGDQTVNVSPLTTLVTKASECAGDQTAQKLDQLWRAVDADLNLGFDAAAFGDPMSDAVTDTNVTSAVLGNEALAELVRRTGAALQADGVALDLVMDTLACDLADGAFDGATLQPRASDLRILSVAKAAEAIVRLEVLAGRLEVDGVDATGAMNDSIRTIRPSASADVRDVALGQAGIDQAIEALAVLQGVYADAELVDLTTLLGEATPAMVGGAVDAALTASVHNTLHGLPERVALAEQSELNSIVTRANDQTDTPPPFISLAADPEMVDAGQGTTLSWAASGAERCVAAGAWEGDRPVDGFFQTDAISSAQTYGLTCFGLGGAATSSVTVGIVGEPTPEPVPTPDPAPDPDPSPDPDPDPDPTADAPTVDFSVDTGVVDAGGSVTLSWTSQHASGCTASGGWSGAREVQGSEVVGPINSTRTFTITCSGAGGSAVAMLSVSAMGQLQISWEAPTENVDGTPISGLSAYRIHRGSSSGSYDEVVEVNGTLTSYTLAAEIGTHYLAMTAVDVDGDESALSNEVQKIAQ